MVDAPLTINGLGMDYWLNRPFNEVFDQIEACLLSPFYTDSFEDCNYFVDILLTCLCVVEGAGEADQTVYTRNYSNHVARLVKETCLRHPNVCSALFYHLPSVPDPSAFVCILPSIMIACPNYKINDAFDSLLALSEHSQCSISILAVLLDIDLSLVRKQRVVQFMEDSLCNSDEADFPPLFKLIFANLNLFSGTSLIRKLRSEVISRDLIHGCLFILFLFKRDYLI